MKINVDNPKNLTSLSLCFGGLGLDRGVERGIAALRNAPREDENWYRGHIEPAAYVEIEAVAAWNLVAQMDKGLLAPRPVWTNLKTFPWEDFYGKIHIITGGYPCQPFSQAGLQGGVDDPRHLFPFIEHGIDAIRPVLCFFENVSNHLNIGYQEVRQRLHRLGYKVEEGIFAAQQVGAPHLRRRLFIMAVADTYCSEPGSGRTDLAEMLGLQEGQRQPEFRSVISGGDSQKLGDTDHQRERQSGRQQSEGRGWNSDTGEKLGNSFQSRLEGHRRHGHRRSEWTDAVRSIASSSFWPAGQGEYQHRSEPPRLESRLGMVVNGYNFVEDLLRMAGNAVVEQQAELAFRTLISRFL